MTLVVVTGVPGAGKSTLAAALAARLGSAFVSLIDPPEWAASAAAKRSLEGMQPTRAQVVP